MKKTGFLIVVALSAFQASAQHASGLLNDYLGVKNALVKSDGRLAAEAAEALYQSVKKEGDFQGREKLLNATEKLSKAGSVVRQREALNDVSAELWKLIKTDEKNNETIFYQYCPMKKSYWLSKGKAIENHYYGASMLTCGKVAETNN